MLHLEHDFSLIFSPDFESASSRWGGRLTYLLTSAMNGWGGWLMKLGFARPQKRSSQGTSQVQRRKQNGLGNLGPTAIILTDIPNGTFCFTAFDSIHSEEMILFKTPTKTWLVWFFYFFHLKWPNRNVRRRFGIVGCIVTNQWSKWRSAAAATQEQVKNLKNFLYVPNFLARIPSQAISFSERNHHDFITFA